MKLFVETQKEQGSATVPVRWCITPAEKQRLLKEDIDPAKALMLMSVVNDGKEVGRFVVPLDQMMVYVPFRQPGKNSIKAIIVYPAAQTTVEKLRGKLLERGKSGFERRVLTHGKDMAFEEEANHFQFKFEAEIVKNSTAEAEVTVDQRFFAKKPFDWPWVNFWLETKPADQCQLRRRRFLAYTIQPIFAAAWYFIIAPVVKIVVTIALLLWGIRPKHIGWKALWFLEPVNDVACDVKRTSDWTRYKRGAEWWDNLPWWFFFSKPLWLAVVIAAVILAVTGIIGFPLTLMVIALSVLIGMVATVVIIGLLALANMLLKALWTKIVMGDLDPDQWEEHRRQVKRAAQQEAELRLAELRQKNLALLACDSGLSFEPTLAALPPEKRTFHLRFQNLKAQVCRPFPA